MDEFQESQEETTFECPYCAVMNTLMVDLTGEPEQKLITDCEICCHPIVVSLVLEDGAVSSVEVERETN